MRGDDEIVELLNEQLTSELTAINQYFLHAKMQANWGFTKLAELVDQPQVGLEVVDVLLLAGEDVLEEVCGGGVALLPAHPNSGTQSFDDFQLDG